MQNKSLVQEQQTQVKLNTQSSQFHVELSTQGSHSNSKNANSFINPLLGDKCIHVLLTFWHFLENSVNVGCCSQITKHSKIHTNRQKYRHMSPSLKVEEKLCRQGRSTGFHFPTNWVAESTCNVSFAAQQRSVRESGDL